MILTFDLRGLSGSSFQPPLCEYCSLSEKAKASSFGFDRDEKSKYFLFYM